MIYAIQCGDGGPIKLGRARDVRKRLSHLQIAHHEKLTILASQETLDDASLESLIHERCSAHRIRGEWFRPEGQVLEVVEEMIQATADRSSTQRYAAKIVADYQNHMTKYHLIQLWSYLKRLTNAKPVHQS